MYARILFPAALSDWKTGALERLSSTELHRDLQRLADRYLTAFGCSAIDYDLDGTVLNYVIYR